MNFSLKQLSIAFVIMSLSFFWSLFKMQRISEENKRLKELIFKSKKISDSLENEIFVKELQLFRYERAVEIFEEKNPNTTSQLSDIISDETE